MKDRKKIRIKKERITDSIMFLLLSLAISILIMLL
jgi:hypothetical protein